MRSHLSATAGPSSTKSSNDINKSNEILLTCRGCPPKKRLSSHTLYRHKDSSEKTPSTRASDDDGYIAPAVPFLLPSPVTHTLDEADFNFSMVYLDTHLETPRTATVHMGTDDSSQAGQAASPQPTASCQHKNLASDTTHRGTPPHGANVHKSNESHESRDTSDTIIHTFWDSPQSDVSLHALSSLPPPPVSQSRSESLPILAPLEPQYRPPTRRPTPPGVPSYEVASQRTLNSRLALRRWGALARTGENTQRQRQGSTSPDLPGDSRQSRWRRHRQEGRRQQQSSACHHNSRQRRHLRHRSFTSATTVPPVWRPPASQHSIANHPYFHDMPPPVAPQDRGMQEAAIARRDSTMQTAATTAAATTAETEARAGRPARAVNLDDYTFLASGRVAEAGATRETETGENALSDDSGIMPKSPSEVLCMVFCTPFYICWRMKKRKDNKKKHIRDGALLV